MSVFFSLSSAANTSSLKGARKDGCSLLNSLFNAAAALEKFGTNHLKTIYSIKNNQSSIMDVESLSYRVASLVVEAISRRLEQIA